jgi:hypothetical protein
MLAARLKDALALSRRLLTLTHTHGEWGCETNALKLLDDLPCHRAPPRAGEAEDT